MPSGGAKNGSWKGKNWVGMLTFDVPIYRKTDSYIIN